MTFIVARYLTSAQHTTWMGAYATCMATPKKTLQDLAKNTKYLRARNKWSQAELAKKSRISQKAISDIENAVYDAKHDTADAIGRAFGLTGWHMLNPNLARDTESGGTIAKMIEGFSQLNEESQQLIMQLVEREIKYGGKK